MRSVSEFEASTILQIRVTFSFSGGNLIPDELTSAIGIEPDFAIEAGAPWRNPLGQQVGVHKTGMWGLTSTNRVDSKDINKHLAVLLEVLLPQRQAIIDISKRFEPTFDVLWKSAYLNAGAGLLLNCETLAGVTSLSAGLRFDIYQEREGPETDPYASTLWFAQ